MILGNFQIFYFLDPVVVAGLDVVPPGGKRNVEPRACRGGLYNPIAMLIVNRDLNVAEIFFPLGRQTRGRDRSPAVLCA